MPNKRIVVDPHDTVHEPVYETLTRHVRAEEPEVETPEELPNANSATFRQLYKSNYSLKGDQNAMNIETIHIPNRFDPRTISGMSQTFETLIRTLNLERFEAKSRASQLFLEYRHLILTPIIFFGWAWILLISYNIKSCIVYSFCVCSTYFIFPIIPIGMASLLPLIILPTLDVTTTAIIGPMYIEQTAYIFLVGSIYSAILLSSGVTERLALLIIQRSKGSVTCLCFITSSMSLILSLILPWHIVAAFMALLLEMIIHHLQSLGLVGFFEGPINPGVWPSYIKILSNLERNCTLLHCEDSSSYWHRQRRPSKTTKFLYLTAMYSISYACYIPAAEYYRVFKLVYPGKNKKLPSITIVIYAVGIPLACAAAWVMCIVIQFLLFGTTQVRLLETSDQIVITKAAQDKLQDLGPITVTEINTLTGLLVTTILIILNNFNLLSVFSYVGCTVVGLLLLYMLPSSWNFQSQYTAERKNPQIPIIHWDIIQQTTEWSIVFNIGATKTLGYCVTNTNIYADVAELMKYFPDLGYWGTGILTLFLGAVICQIGHRRYTIQFLYEVLKDKYFFKKINPYVVEQFMTVACSYENCFYISAPYITTLGFRAHLGTWDVFKFGVVATLIILVLSSFWCLMVFSIIYDVYDVEMWDAIVN